VTGPATYHGNGYYWVQQGIPVGTYTITWNGVSECGTPASETKSTNTQGSVAFTGNYQSISNAPTPTPVPTPTPTPVPSSPSGRYMTIGSNPPSASVYINGSLMGKAPVKVKLPENVPIKIKCTLPNYSDYTYNYPAVSPLPAGIASVNSDWTCTLKKLLSTTSSPSPSPAPSQSYQPRQQPNETVGPTLSPATPTPYITSTPPVMESKGFFSRVFGSVKSFFGKLFGRKSSSPPASTPTNSQDPTGSSDNKLEGVWKVEQILMYDPLIKDFRPTQAGGNYTQYKGNQVCINGVLGPNDMPQPCPRYETFTISKDQIIMPSVTAYSIHFKLSGDKLELSLEPKTGPTTPNSPQKQKIILSRLHKNVPDYPASNQPQASATPKATSTPVIAPIKTPTPTPIPSIKPTPTPSPVQSTAVQNLQGLWTTENSADRNMGINDMEFNGNKFCSVSNLCALGKADYWTYTVEGNAIVIKEPIQAGELGGGGTGYATLTYYFYFQGSKLVITFPGGSKYTFVKIPIYATPTPTSMY